VSEQYVTELAQFDALQAEVALLVKPTLGLKVGTDQECKAAESAVKTVKALVNQVEARRKDLVKPLKDRAKVIDQYAAKISEPLENAEKHLKIELAAWSQVIEDRRREEIRKAEEQRRKQEAIARKEAEAAREEAEAVALFAPDDGSAERARAEAAAAESRRQDEIARAHAQNVTNIDSMKVAGAKKVWKHSVVDPNLVPREYLVVDETKIRAAIRDGAREIPGVTIFQETQIAVR
jgi:hypothetical protein